MGIEGQDVVVTGGTGALGQAVVRELLDCGARCHVTFRSQSEADAFELRDQNNVVMHEVELTDEAEVAGVYEQTSNLWASLHLAGGFIMAPIDQTGVDMFRQMYEQNTVTCFLCCREAAKVMRKAGKGGRIVNVAARPVLQPKGGMVGYTCAKAAVASLTQCLADELKSEGIFVNAVLPSIINTPATRKAMPEADHNKWPTPEQIALVVRELASHHNATVSGGLLPVYGCV